MSARISDYLDTYLIAWCEPNGASLGSPELRRYGAVPSAPFIVGREQDVVGLLTQYIVDLSLKGQACARTCMQIADNV